MDLGLLSAQLGMPRTQSPRLWLPGPLPEQPGESGDVVLPEV